MKKENFKIGTTVFFMQSNKPQSGEVKSIISIEGEVKIDYTTYKVPEGEKQIVYAVGYNILKEQEVFANLEDLKSSVFNDEIESK